MSWINAFGEYYRGSRVLVTGDTGFKGSWLCHWLLELGAVVDAIGLPPATEPALFNVLGLSDRLRHHNLDIRDTEAMDTLFARVEPDIIFHLAAQALVKRSYVQPLETLQTNVMGTANVLQAATKLGRKGKSCVVIAVASDKCYENRETHHAYREEDPMGGHDIYSMSKGCAELLVSSWRRSFCSTGSLCTTRIASCRAGNVIGGGDWSVDRIVVDCVKSLDRSETIFVRNPASIRPWQHVLEPLSGYLLVAERMARSDRPESFCEAWNFGPGEKSERTVADLCDLITRYWGRGAWKSTPDPEGVHEAQLLKLSIDKARQVLGWKPVWDFETAVAYTVSWYKQFYHHPQDFEQIRASTSQQIAAYTQDALKAALPWTSGRE